MSQQSKIARRTFFAVLGGAAAAGVAAKLASSSPPIPRGAEAAKEAQGDSYRLTDHIKKYYRTTTI